MSPPRYPLWMSLPFYLSPTKNQQVRGGWDLPDFEDEFPGDVPRVRNIAVNTELALKVLSH